MIPMPTWMGLPVGEDTRQTDFWISWDGYYLAECPHGAWAVWDAYALAPMCDCDEETA